MNSVHCSRCVCVCVSTAPGVCTWMGQIQRTHFTAGYTLYNYVCEKKNVYRFLQNRYPIMVNCLNIGKNIGRSLPNIRDVQANTAFPCMLWHPGAQQLSMLKWCKFCKV